MLSKRMGIFNKRDNNGCGTSERNMETKRAEGNEIKTENIMKKIPNITTNQIDGWNGESQSNQECEQKESRTERARKKERLLQSCFRRDPISWKYHLKKIPP